MSASSPQAAVPAANSASSGSDQLQVMLRQHIHRAGQLLKIQDLATYTFLWLGAITLTWIAACMVEHWLVPLPAFVRWPIWFAMVGLSGWLAVRYMLPLVVRRINPDYVAQRIERAEPELKTGLVSWLQLESMPDSGVPRGIMAGLARHAARHIHADDPSSSLDTRWLIKTIGITTLMMAMLAVYGMLSPKSVLDTGRRVFHPGPTYPHRHGCSWSNSRRAIAKSRRVSHYRYKSSLKGCAAANWSTCATALWMASCATRLNRSMPTSKALNSPGACRPPRPVAAAAAACNMKSIIGSKPVI